MGTNLQDSEKFVQLLDDGINRSSSGESTSLILVDVGFGFVGVESLLVNEKRENDETRDQSTITRSKRDGS